jgi:hypothetical protein
MEVLGLTVNDILSAKNPGINADGFILELYGAAAGTAGLIDTANTTSYYDSDADSYGEGDIQTNQLWESSSAITTLKVNELREGAAETPGTFVLSFDNGSSWSTDVNQFNTDVTDFTGTASDGGTYKLKLKMSIGDSYVDGYIWTTTSSLNAVKERGDGDGDISGAILVGGLSGGSDDTELWNGSSWVTTSAILTTGVYDNAVCGTSVSALSMCGWSSVYSNKTEKWNGSIWSTTSTVNQAVDGPAACGTGIAGLKSGGRASGAGVTVNATAITEIWDDSSWTTTGAMNETKTGHGMCGTTSASLICGGYSNTSIYISSTEIWNGTSWATTSPINKAPRFTRNTGTTSSALNFGGYTSGTVRQDVTEIWSGSSWATTTSLITAVYGHQVAGTATDSLSFGGNTGATVATTERWLGVGIQTGFALKIN